MGKKNQTYFFIILGIIGFIGLSVSLLSGTIVQPAIPGIGITPTQTTDYTKSMQIMGYHPATPTLTPTQVVSVSTPIPTPVANPSGLLHVNGPNIVDQNNNTVVLRGVQIPSELNSGWKGGSTSISILNTTVFTTIKSWGANTLRLPVGAYEYKLPGYMQFLDTVVNQANQAGLYVILANFEDPQAMGGNSTLDQTGLQFWQFIAQHYTNNPMVLFDIINEPQNNSYNEWLNGGGNVVGMQQVINGIRSAGGKQIVVAEWIDQGTAGFAGFTSFINDPNVIYSMHIYFKSPNLRTSNGWDSDFGNLSTTHPILIGEWALLPNARYLSFCQGLDATSGTQLVQNFLNYMQQHQISWTAWAFKPPHLLLDETTFTPTTLNAPWCCGSGPVCNAGMGTLIKTYLSTHP